MADEKTITERIKTITGSDASKDAIAYVANAANVNPLVGQYLEDIVSHKDFPDKYGYVINGINIAQTLGIDNKESIERILRSDVDPVLMEQAFFAAGNKVPYSDIDKALNIYVQSVNDGLDSDKAVRYSSNILSCETNGFTQLYMADGNTCRYTPEQMDALASLCKNISDFAAEKKEHAENNPGKILPNGYFQKYLYDVIDYCCDDNIENLSPDQIKAVGQCVCESVQRMYPDRIPVKLSAEEMDSIEQRTDAIQGHKSYYAVYENIINHKEYSPNEEPDNIWTMAKRAEVDKEIANSYEAVNYDDPIAGLKRICKNAGLDKEATAMIAEKAEPMINQNLFLKDHDADNLDIRCMADMLIEGLSPDDTIEYTGIVAHNSKSMNCLYDCINAGLSKEVVKSCVSEGLDKKQRMEVILGQSNGLPEKDLLKLCADRPAEDLRKVRLNLENARKPHIGDEIVKKGKVAAQYKGPGNETEKDDINR